MTDDRPDNGGQDRLDRPSVTWTPREGFLRGLAAGIIAAFVLGAVYCELAVRRPDMTVFYVDEDAKVALVLIAVGAMVGFIVTWILFAVVHRSSQTVGLPSTATVVLLAVLVVLAKQCALALGDAKPPSGYAGGGTWLAPWVVLKANLGVWLGIVLAVVVFKDGDSVSDLFG